MIWDMAFLQSPDNPPQDAQSTQAAQQPTQPPNPAGPHDAEGQEAGGLTEKITHIKTPRPDITIAMRHQTVVQALEKQGLTNHHANQFLTFLQNDRHLLSDPCVTNKDIRFPALVLEGKSYTTGKTLFEAQNQAAGSGASMNNIQQSLANMAIKATKGAYQPKPPLAFSICTEGPILELWVHYMTMQEPPQHHMNVVETGHSAFFQKTLAFLVMVDNVMGWMSGEFLDRVVKELMMVENQGRRGEN